MKKIVLLSLFVLASLMLAAQAPAIVVKDLVVDGGYTGDKIIIGTVTVTDVGAYLTVVFDTSGGDANGDVWEMLETHLYIGWRASSQVGSRTVSIR